jgi:hypothetical protein
MNDLMSESWTVTGLGGNIDSPTSPLTLEKLPIRVYSGAGHYRNQGGVVCSLSTSPTNKLTFSSQFETLQDNTNMTKPLWKSQLEKDGYVVIPGVVPEEECDDFQESAWKWLESFPWGFKRDDRTTWVADKLPYSVTYVIPHKRS